MASSESEALNRIADALEFFVGVHPAYQPTPGKPPLPSSIQARKIEDARLKAEAQAKAVADKVEADRAAAEAAEKVRLAKVEADRLAAEAKAKQDAAEAAKKAREAETPKFDPKTLDLSKLNLDPMAPVRLGPK